MGASNQWFARTLSALAVPRTGESELAAKVAELWLHLETCPRVALPYARANVEPLQFGLAEWSDDEIWEAMDSHRAHLDIAEDGTAEEGFPDLRAEEWAIFAASRHPAPTPDFTLHRQDVPAELSGHLDDLVQVERLREARALVGFTRLDAPDPEGPDLVPTAPLGRAEHLDWVPATEVRGEGLFIKLPEPLLQQWEEQVAESEVVVAHREAYRRYRTNRRSDRLKGTFKPLAGWPGARVPDSEGTLGGLVSLGEPRTFTRVFRRALADAHRCSSDPLCSERIPTAPADFLHGAACHVCLFVSETTCERGNRFLDRRFVVPIDPAFPAVYPDAVR